MAADIDGADGVLDRRTLRGGATLTLRVANVGDLGGVRRLYEGLSIEDRHRRFHASVPGDRVLARWLTCDDTGMAVVVEADIPGARREIVAEAGFRRADDGEAEFAITVDPCWRGGLGIWVLEHLQGLARERGFDHLAAHVFADNQPMRGLLERLGYATIDRPDRESMRALVGTDDTIPGWLDATRPRVLVESDGGHWFAEQALRDAGYDVAVCPGPRGRRSPCPLLEGRDCRLAGGADLIITALRGPEGRQLQRAHDRQPGSAQRLDGASVPTTGSGAAAVEAVRALLPTADRRPPDRTAEQR